MVMTILEAQVAQDKWKMLEDEYKQALQQLDPGITQTYLLHEFKDQTLWRIATIWESRAALDAMRASGITPRGVLIFRAAGAEPTLTVFEIAAWSGK